MILSATNPLYFERVLIVLVTQVLQLHPNCTRGVKVSQSSTMLMAIQVVGSACGDRSPAIHDASIVWFISCAIQSAR